jgi:DNA topoisomerase I
MSYELIITEKPSAAQKIAEALSDSKPHKTSFEQVPVFELTHNAKPIKVTCAVGHLYTVTQIDTSKGWTYPVFDLVWEQSSKVNKGSSYTSAYVSAIKKLAKDATEFTVATDFDIEGEVIGMNVIVYACKRKDANRMKFSTLTKPDIVKAYEHKSPTLEWGQGLAGKTRHELDWYYGINLSRALSLAVQKAGAFKVLSSGRIQGPALRLLVEKEREISSFVPTPYWEIVLHALAQKNPLIANHVEDKFTDKSHVDTVYAQVKDAKQTTVKQVSSSQFNQAPPTPFDLTTLQIECFRVHSIVPKETLDLAQDLYINGYISYPRTSSQKLPPELGFKKILTELAKQETYAKLSSALLTMPILKPNNGEKEDEAHPAIYPTGIVPAKLSDRHLKLYDLIVRRFLATFAPIAVRETMTVLLDCNTQEFVTKGTRTVAKGWHEYYGQYATFDEVTLPALAKGEVLPVTQIEFLSKQTKPPKRYTAASVIKELEKQNLGTKSTRATIIDTLYDRGYVDAKSIEVTALGMKTCETLEKFCPEILDANLTREFEEEMEDIRKKTKKPDEVLSHAKQVLSTLLTQFKKKELDIGQSLLQAQRDTQDASSTVGKCECGGSLRLTKGKFGLFISCNKYPECTKTYSLPKGLFKPNDAKPCPHCLFPTIIKIAKGKKPQELCFNPACPAKQQSLVESHPMQGKLCPKCQVGTMTLRKSLYGQFLGCSNYPKCKHIISLQKPSTNTSGQNSAKPSEQSSTPTASPAGKTILASSSFQQSAVAAKVIADVASAPKKKKKTSSSASKKPIPK